MAVNVEVIKKERESNPNVIKRFTRRTQESGVLSKVRKNRYLKRSKSPLVRRKHKIEAIKKRTEVEKQVRLGKIVITRGRKR